MAKVIPLNPERLAYRVRTTVGGKRLVIDVEWRERSRMWVIGFYTQALEPILLNCPAVVGWPLASRLLDDRMPAGSFVIIRTDALERMPEKDELGVSALLFYIEPGEVLPDPDPDAPLAVEVG